MEDMGGENGFAMQKKSFIHGTIPRYLQSQNYIRSAVTIVSFLNVNAHTTGTNSNVSHS